MSDSGDVKVSELAVDGSVLQPGQSIKPCVSSQTAIQLIRTHFAYEVKHIKELNSYDDNNFFVQARNVTSGEEGKFVFKVLNAMDSQKPAHVEAENECMLFLHSKGVVCPTPVISLHGTTFPLIQIPVQPDEQNNLSGDGTSPSHICRLLTFVEGQILHQVTITQNLLFEMGKYIAQLGKLLKGFSHPALPNHKTIWLLSAAPYLRNFMHVIKQEPAKYELVNGVLNAFVANVEPAYSRLEKGVCHGDFNEQNIIVRPNPADPQEHLIQGLIDFGDLQLSPYLFEMAITLCYMMLQCMTGDMDPLEGSGYCLAGYMTERPVPQLELELLRTCISARLCQSVVMGAYTHAQDPGNSYLLTTSTTGWRLLDRLWNQTTDQQLMQAWQKVIGSDRGD